MHSDGNDGSIAIDVDIHPPYYIPQEWSQASPAIFIQTLMMSGEWKYVEKFLPIEFSSRAFSLLSEVEVEAFSV